MSREIKFRAWDGQLNQMIHQGDDEYQFVLEEKLRLFDKNFDGFISAEFMQYTGLKDKNGVEIYEGDIYHHGDPRITYTVVWADSGLMGKQNSSTSYAGLESWCDQIEVIGNIYEGVR